ncbi:MAG: hypothetical protein AAFV95_09435 [Bacteroidota bacterium]
MKNRIEQAQEKTPKMTLIFFMLHSTFLLFQSTGQCSPAIGYENVEQRTLTNDTCLLYHWKVLDLSHDILLNVDDYLQYEEEYTLIQLPNGNSILHQIKSLDFEKTYITDHGIWHREESGEALIRFDGFQMTITSNADQIEYNGLSIANFTLAKEEDSLPLIISSPHFDDIYNSWQPFNEYFPCYGLRLYKHMGDLYFDLSKIDREISSKVVHYIESIDLFLLESGDLVFIEFGVGADEKINQIGVRFIDDKRLLSCGFEADE